MDIFSVQPPLSNIQAEMLKLFSAEIPEKELEELKDMIANFLLEKVRDKADAEWDKRGYADEILKQMLSK